MLDCQEGRMQATHPREAWSVNLEGKKKPRPISWVGLRYFTLGGSSTDDTIVESFFPKGFLCNSKRTSMINLLVRSEERTLQNKNRRPNLEAPDKPSPKNIDSIETL
jgi:hypothetical protein